MTEWEYRDLLEKKEQQELLRREELIRDARKEARSDAFCQCKDISVFYAIALCVVKIMLFGLLFGSNKMVNIVCVAELAFWIIGYRLILWLKE